MYPNTMPMYELISVTSVESMNQNNSRERRRTGAQRPDERVALGDESPAGAKAEETNALVAGTSAEQVAQERVPAIVRQADDGDGGEEGEGVLRDPLPEEDTGELASTK